MSFILDALKKLEQKRQQGSVPDLMTIHAPERQRHEKRAVWPYIVIGILVLNAAILTAVFRPWESDIKKSASNVPSRPHVNKSETVSPAPKVKMDTVLTNKKPVVLKKRETAGTQTAVAKKAAPVPKHDNAITPPEPKTKEPLKVEEPSVINKLPEDEYNPSALSLNPSPEEMEILRGKIKEETSRSAAPAPGKDLPVKKTVAGPDEQVPDFSQLPEETKRELPQLNISAHIYSNNPRSRIVNINGSTVREGDEITKGLKVREITMSGVIFDYAGRSFQVRAF